MLPLQFIEYRTITAPNNIEYLLQEVSIRSINHQMEFSCLYLPIRDFFIGFERVMALKSFIMKITQMLLTRRIISRVYLRDLGHAVAIKQFVSGMLTNIKCMRGFPLQLAIRFALRLRTKS